LFLPVEAGSMETNFGLGCHHPGRPSQPDRGTCAIALIQHKRTPALEAHVFTNLQGGNQNAAWTAKTNTNPSAQLASLQLECLKIVGADLARNGDQLTAIP